MGKKSLEHSIIKETSYLIDEIQKQNKNAFDISVIVSCFFYPICKVLSFDKGKKLIQ